MFGTEAKLEIRAEKPEIFSSVIVLFKFSLSTLFIEEEKKFLTYQRLCEK